MLRVLSVHAGKIYAKYHTEPLQENLRRLVTDNVVHTSGDVPGQIKHLWLCEDGKFFYIIDTRAKEFKLLFVGNSKKTHPIEAYEDFRTIFTGAVAENLGIRSAIR